MNKSIFVILITFIIVFSACEGVFEKESEEEKSEKILKGLKIEAKIDSEKGIPYEKQGFNIIGVSHSASVIVAAAAHGKLYYSYDGGINWYIISGLGEEYWTGISISDDGNNIAVAGENLYVSNDSGDTWYVYYFGSGYDGDTKVLISNDGSTIIREGTHKISEFSISNDYGNQWKNFSFSSDVESLSISEDGQTLGVLYYYENLYLSVDNGKTWKETVSGKKQWSNMKMSTDGKTIVLLDFGAADFYPEIKAAISISRDKGVTWSYHIIDGIQALTGLAIYNDGSNILVSSTYISDSFRESVDYGETWQVINKPDEVMNSAGPDYSLSYLSSGTTIIALEKGYSLWSSSDKGKTWTKRLHGDNSE